MEAIGVDVNGKRYKYPCTIMFGSWHIIFNEPVELTRLKTPNGVGILVCKGNVKIHNIQASKSLSLFVCDRGCIDITKDYGDFKIWVNYDR